MPRLFWTSEKLAAASRMWKSGALIMDIARAFDVTSVSITKMAAERRGAFPSRKVVIRREEPARRPVVEVSKSTGVASYPDRVKRTTISGAKVTLPRVVFIDGPYQEAAE